MCVRASRRGIRACPVGTSNRYQSWCLVWTILCQSGHEKTWTNHSLPTCQIYQLRRPCQLRTRLYQAMYRAMRLWDIVLAPFFLLSVYMLVKSCMYIRRTTSSDTDTLYTGQWSVCTQAGHSCQPVLSLPICVKWNTYVAKSETCLCVCCYVVGIVLYAGELWPRPFNLSMLTCPTHTSASA